MKLLAVTKDYYLNKILPREKMLQEDPKAIYSLRTESGGGITQIKGNTATIFITGELGNDWWSDTQYTAIINAIENAEANPDVEKIVLEMNTPGGYVDGVIDVVKAIRNAKKPITAKAGYLIASAGYWIASATDKIVATTNIASFGSIGVLVSYVDYSEYLKKEGIKEIVLTSTDAPEKYIDGGTEEGQKKIIERLNRIHLEFVESVAKGRNTTVETVNETFGKGGVLFAEEALKIGMIDEITNEEEEINEMANEITQQQLEEAVANAKKEVLEDVAKHLKFVGKVETDKIIANIKEQKSFLEVAESYYDEALQSELAKARIEGNKEEEQEAIKTEDEADKQRHQEEEEKLDLEKMNELAKQEFFI